MSRITARNWLGASADRWTEEKDLVIIGGGVAGYVAAIKAGQAGMKVSKTHPDNGKITRLTQADRSPASKSVAPWVELA